MITYLLYSIAILRVINISCGGATGVNSISTDIYFPTLYLNDSVLRPNRYAIVDFKSIISSNVYSSMMSGSFSNSLNGIEISILRHLTKNSSFQCQDISSNSNERMALELLDSRIGITNKDPHFPSLILSKVLSCLADERSTINIIPYSLIPSKSIPLVHNAIYYSLGSVHFKQMMYDMSYWHSVGKRLSYTLNGHRPEIRYISKSSLESIALRSYVVDNDRLERLNKDFIKFWFDSSDDDVRNLHVFMLSVRKEETSMESIVKYLTDKQMSINCSSYLDLFNTYASVCSYYFYINWLLGKLSNTDYFRYRYSSTFDMNRMDTRRACMTYAGHVPGFNNRFLEYESYYQRYEFRFNKIRDELHLNEILSRVNIILEDYNNEMYTEIANELLMIYSNNQHKLFYIREVNEKVALLIQKDTVCRDKI